MVFTSCVCVDEPVVVISHLYDWARKNIFDWQGLVASIRLNTWAMASNLRQSAPLRWNQGAPRTCSKLRSDVMTTRFKSCVSCLLAISLTLVIPALTARAQDSTKPAASPSQKEKEAEQRQELQKNTLILLNDVASASWSLKLPENRLLVMSNAAHL